MTMHQPPALSPAAQAVLDAMYEVNMDFGKENAKLAAAALRAAAHQVAPIASYSVESPWCVGFADRDAQLRRDILAIAAELEGASA